MNQHNGFKPVQAPVYEAAAMAMRNGQLHASRSTMTDAVEEVNRVALAYIGGDMGEPGHPDTLALVRELTTGFERAVAYLKLGFPVHVRELLDDLVREEAGRNGDSIIPHGQEGDFYVMRHTELAQAQAMYRTEVDQETGEVQHVVLMPYLYSNGSPQYRENPAIRKPRTLSPEAQAMYEQASKQGAAKHEQLLDFLNPNG